MTPIELRQKYERLKGQYQQIENGIESDIKELSKQQRRLERYEQAREVIREVGLITQQQIQFHISDITSMALEAVFPNPYKLVLEFVQRRNKTECDIYFERNGKRIDPQEASGGGAIDIAAFALRIASWSLSTPKLRNTIILDEPMRFVSKEYRNDAANMIKEVSKQLGIQFIIVTHDPTLSIFADKIFEVSIKKGISMIKKGL